MGSLTLSNSVYDKLKHMTQVGFPALGSLYFGLAQIWGFPAGEQVVGSLALITTFFGVILGISSKNYEPDDMAGDFVIDTKTDGLKVVQFKLSKDPEEIISKDSITFKVIDSDKKFWNAE